MNAEKGKVRCLECAWKGKEGQVLKAPSPFEVTDEIEGCPECRDVNTINRICDEHGCWQFISCGTPTKTGYRHTCGEHIPDRNK